MGKSNGKWAAGAVLAGATGFVAGILTAPKSGKETRQSIKSAALKAKSEAEKNLKSLHSELNEKLANAKKMGEELSDKAKSELDMVVGKAQIAKDKVREILSSLHDGDADDPDLKKALKEAKDSLSALEKFVKKPVSKSK